MKATGVLSDHQKKQGGKAKKKKGTHHRTKNKVKGGGKWIVMTDKTQNQRGDKTTEHSAKHVKQKAKNCWWASLRHRSVY